MNKAPRLVLLLGCLGGFGFIVVTHLQNWLSDKRSTTSSVRIESKLPFPTILFCPKHASTSEDFFPFVDEDSYVRDAVNLSVGVWKVQKFEFDMKSVVPDVTTEDLFTIYNGLCKVFIINKTYGIEQMINFLYPIGQSMTIFYLPNRHDQIFIAMMALLDTNFAVFDLNSSMMTTISLTEHTYLNHKKHPCSPEPLSKCAIRKIREMLELEKIQCVPILIHKFFDDYKVCSDNETIASVILIVMRFMNNMRSNFDAVGCHKPCKRQSYSLQKVPMDLARYSTSNINDTLLLSYVNGFVSVEEEYIIYDVIDILSAIGGALGMFLGWSIYQNLESIWDQVAIKLRQKRKN